MRGSVRGCHTERVFHCGLFPLSLTMYFTNLFPCITLSICYLSYEGATVLARIAMLFNLCFQCQFACGSWLGQPGAAGNDRTLQDFLISSLFSVSYSSGFLVPDLGGVVTWCVPCGAYFFPTFSEETFNYLIFSMSRHALISLLSVAWLFTVILINTSQ